MALIHQVYDTDAHFKIDPVTRAIKNESTGKNVLIQYDHNSERFTFELPKLIDGHDMSKSTAVEVHYINIKTKTDKKEEDKSNEGVYHINDLQISPEDANVVICSWLISQNATQYAGSLNFLLKFKCVDAGGNVVYRWNTAIYTQISVSSGMDNGEAIVEEYSDILAQWEARIDALEANAGGEAVCTSYEEPTSPEARVWVNPNGAVGNGEKKTETISATTVAGIVGLALNEMLNNTAARYATIQDAHDGASATADGKVLAYTCGGAMNIMLLDNIESASVINITKDCTLHLNGKTLSFTATGAYLNITTASQVTINGEVAGSEITMNLSNGLNDKLVSVTDTTLHMVGGTYSMYGTYATAAIAIRCETTSTRVEMDGCSFNSDIDFAQGAYAVQVYGDCEMEHCSINAITRDVKYCYPINTNSKSNTFRIANSSINVKCSKVGGLVRGISVFSKVATIENCRITADGYGDVSASEVCAVCAINSGENTLLTINGGYYYGAREALGIHGEVKINGGVYAGSQHGGGYMSAPAIKAQNAIFRNVEYTGDCGWDDAHFGAVYCGDSDSNADVSFDNCRFESKNHATQGITAKYINTKVYLSNCVIDGNFGQDLRADATCTIYVGKNVEYDTVFENGGTVDTTTYADQEFGFETETTTSHAVLSVKDERGNWVGIA